MLKEQEFHLTSKKGSTTNSGSGDSVVSLPAPVGPASGSNLKTESESESKSRSVSREKSLTKSDREKDTPDRKARKERDRESKERSREDRSSKVQINKLFYLYSNRNCNKFIMRRNDPLETVKLLLAVLYIRSDCIQHTSFLATTIEVAILVLT